MSPFYIYSKGRGSDPCKMRVWSPFITPILTYLGPYLLYGPRFYHSVGSHNHMHICAFRQKGVPCCTQLLKILNASVCDIDEFDKKKKNHQLLTTWQKNIGISMTFQLHFCLTMSLASKNHVTATCPESKP